MFKKIYQHYVFGELKIWEYFLIFMVLFLCFFSFQQGDILHTAGSSFGLLYGHILDFYDYNEAGGLLDAYMISTYIVFAIWNIPLRLMHIGQTPTMNFSTGAVMWFKFLPVIFYFLCALVIIKIAKMQNFGTKNTKLAAIAFITMPTAVFSQFIFGQYDSITLFFVLLGYYYYLKDKELAFIFSFGMAITFKYFALLVFLPLLLMKEKNIWKIILSGILVCLPFLIETLLYIQSEGYKYVTGFGATGYIFNASIDLGPDKISLVVLLVGVICAYSYFQPIDVNDSKEVFKWSLFMINLIMFAIFGLCPWHPQWLLLMTPFLVLATFINKNMKIHLILDVILFVFEIMYTVNYWSDHVDQALVKLGIWGKYLANNIGQNLMMKDIYIVKDLNLLISLFSGVLLISVLFKHPKYTKEEYNLDIKESVGWIRTRFLAGMLFFLVPMGLCIMMSV